MVTSDLRKAVEQATPKHKDLGKTDPHNAVSTEKWIQKYGIPYTVLLKIPLSKINWRESRNNQARPKAVVPENVARYEQAMKEGDVFPPVVGHLEGDKVVLIDGNNRDAAARNVQGASGFLYGFLVVANSATIYTMMVDANAHHGETPSEEWRLEQAIHLQDFGLTAEQAARAAKVKPGVFSRYKRELAAYARAEANRVKGFENIQSGNGRVQLATIKLETVFGQASQVAVDTDMSLSEIKAFTDAIKQCPSESMMLELVSETRKARELEARRVKAGGARTATNNKLLSLTTGIGKIMHADVSKIAAMAETDEDIDLISSKCEEAATKLLDIMDALKKRSERRG